MNLLPASALETFRRVLQDETLSITIESRFGAKNQNHQTELRQTSLATSANLVSRSHCPESGGFATSDKMKSGLGFDLEVYERITKPIVTRVCSSEELLAAGDSWPSLWVAKEACFKSLRGPQQPKLVSELHIGEWVRLDSQFETCKLLLPEAFGALAGNGAIYRNSEIFCAVFSLQYPGF